MDDSINRQEAINIIKKASSAVMLQCKAHYDPEVGDMVYDDIDTINKLLTLNKNACLKLQALPPSPRWTPIETRPMTDDERKECSERLGFDVEYADAVIFTSQLPLDGQEVITCDRYGNIKIDKFVCDSDFGCYFENNGEMDGIVAWMPLPHRYLKEDGSNKKN